MTADDITRRLMAWVNPSHFVLPRYTPDQWWECDLIELTTARYWREYEVKISRSDFLADAKKERINRGIWNTSTFRWEGQAKQLKHDLMRDAAHGPRQFWYVCPAGMVSPEEVPDWAGLITVQEPPNGRRWNDLSLTEVRKAPNRHSRKIEEKVEAHCRGVVYWRWRALVMGNMDLGNDVDNRAISGNSEPAQADSGKTRT